MFGIVRRKSHGLMARSEFGQGVEHFRAAATHAARGTGATVGPKLESARGRVQPAAGKVRDVASSGWGTALATLAPLAAAATEGARQAGRKTDKAGKTTRKAGGKQAKKLDRKARKMVGRKQSSSKGKLLGLGIAGLAVGAIGAMVLRKRQQEQWDEYDPSQPIGAVGQETIPAAMTPEPARTATLSSVPDEKDQTSSAQHSPTVAKMAGGESPN
ncbi:hypothetical protein [Spirilliplanes yamanashiensis]|uniref:Uncharacterized protein n=1 Tax=Spirilliplanes yamanashiensis TaxID=42233 RepID=A0A8J4DHU4_9ACTN|nr:hypothetical protein [Spirilliplanes yamanashiensis]MDP9814803.1 hypothetical protein [Spirilliplanes yamanashiensis]GIJ02457.1 hypothetical protein Sya03_18090 [Spirilliplanes yamanashiensis]